MVMVVVVMMVEGRDDIAYGHERGRLEDLVFLSSSM